MPHIVDERPAAPAEAGGAGEAGRGGLGRQRRWRLWFLLSALAIGVVACLVVLAAAALDSLLATSSPSAEPAAVPPGGVGIVRVLASTGQVRAGPSFAELNGIADGLDGVWVTGGYARQNHVLYAVDSATGRVVGRVELPSRVVINPGDITVGSGAVWAAVGASVYRIEPVNAVTEGQAHRAFATLPHGGLIGGLAVDDGSIWVTDTTRGKVYRFAASTGRLEASITVGATADAITAGDGGVWVADNDAHTVSRISVTHNQVDWVVTVPGTPGAMAANDNSVWVTDGAAGTVSVLGGASGRVITVRVGGEPTGVAATEGTVWVANTADGTLSRIDAGRHAVVATVHVGARPYALAADRQGVWVALLGRPAMMHTSPGSSQLAPTAGTPPQLLRLCGR